MELMLQDLVNKIKQRVRELPLEEKIDALNQIRKELHEISPFQEEPVDCVVWVKVDEVHANDYNPNIVASPEMKLLHTSIKEDGYTQPIVAYDPSDQKESESGFEVVDGFHRNRIGKEYADIKERIHGYLPLTIINKPLEERIAATIRHNRARGTHQIRPMSDIVLELTKYGWSDEKICQQLGMDLDEVIRLKQITGLIEAFAGHEFSKSWEAFEEKYYK